MPKLIKLRRTGMMLMVGLLIDFTGEGVPSGSDVILDGGGMSPLARAALLYLLKSMFTFSSGTRSVSDFGPMSMIFDSNTWSWNTSAKGWSGNF